MIQFTATIKKFAEKGEKTGWAYVEVSAENAQKLGPGNKRSFRVKGFLDDYAIGGIALVPMGGGDFILAVNAGIRKKIRKEKGDKIKVQLEIDGAEIKPPQELIECMQDEPGASEYFYSLPKSHQNYFTKWIESAKTDATKTKRIAHTINALSSGIDFGEMLRNMKKNKIDLPG